MKPLTAIFPSVARSPAEPAAAVLAALREKIARIERRMDGAAAGPAVPLDVPALDRTLPEGGLPAAALHEVAAVHPGPGTGFALWLTARLAAARPGPVLWVRPAGGRFDAQPYAPGLRTLLDPGRLLLAEAPRGVDLAWCLEEGLRCGALAAVLGETGRLDLTTGRRLQLAAESGGLGAVLLHADQADAAIAAATTRWRVAALPSPRHDGAAPRARWHVELLRVRGRPTMTTGLWTMEWDDATGHLSLASPPADRAPGTARSGLAEPAGGDPGGYRRRAASGRGQ